VDTLEIRELGPELEKPLARFFAAVIDQGVDKWFHPHPFTEKEASLRVNYSGRDAYYAVVLRGEIIAYGMLRGWDEGFNIPSLGIAVHPLHEGRGIARVFIRFLHLVAIYKGAERVRLKVHTENARARQLYEGIGYHFSSSEGESLVGTRILRRTRVESQSAQEL
jgi:GNAT superfamily N-acetyltransferase